MLFVAVDYFSAAPSDNQGIGLPRQGRPRRLDFPTMMGKCPCFGMSRMFKAARLLGQSKSMHLRAVVA